MMIVFLWSNRLIKNFSLIWILVIGSVFWGIANAFFHTAFEAWLIQEYRDVRNSSNLFHLIYIYIYIIAFIGISIISTNITKWMLVITQKTINSNFICIIDVATAAASIGVGVLAQLLAQLVDFK
jgi:hypothetical protein